MLIVLAAVTLLCIISGIVATYFLYQGAFDLSAQILALKNFDQVTPEIWAQLQALAHRESQLTRGLILVAISTFLLGIVIPALLLRKLINTLRSLENQLRESIRTAIHDMTHTLERYGDEPFINARYWAEVAMIALQFFARGSRNPSLMLAVDLLELTRQEMALAKANPKTAR